MANIDGQKPSLPSLTTAGIVAAGQPRPPAPTRPTGGRVLFQGIRGFDYRQSMASKQQERGFYH